MYNIINKQMSADYYNAPSHANEIFAQLGIDANHINPALDPANQPKQIGREVSKKANKYVENFLAQSKQHQQDYDVPKTLAPVSFVHRKQKVSMSKNEDTQPKGRKKQSKKDQLKKNKGKSSKNEQKKEEVQINVQLDQVAQWGEKGTNVHKDEQSDNFDDDQDNQKQKNTTEEQERIRKNIEQKIKKYENPGTSNNKQKNTIGSLQSKAEQLKKKNDQVVKSEQKAEKKKLNLQQSTHELVKGEVKKVKQNVVKEQEQQQQQEESEDPWQKINNQTLAQKKGEAEALKAAAEMDLNKYYEHLDLPDQEDMQQEEPKTGFFQTLCACLSSKSKPNTEVERQILKLSKVQLTNKPEQVTLLKSIWTKLTNKKYLRYGQHWSQIGFQGRDPATDLRSTGILSLLHWDSFISFDHEFCNKIFNFCTQFDIPMALTHIKVTSLVCSSLKKRQIGGRNWSDLLQWYYALCYFTFEYIMSNGKSLDQVGQLVQKSIERTKNGLQDAKKHFNLNIKSKR